MCPAVLNLYVTRRRWRAVIVVRMWMIYSAMAFAWVGSVVYNAAVVFPTSSVTGGACHTYSMHAAARRDTVGRSWWFAVSALGIFSSR